MKILVCGNLGYIGPIVCKHLKKTIKNSEIYGLDIGYFSSYVTTMGRLGDTYCDKQFYYDVRNIDYSFYSKFDSIVLLSAISNDPMGNKFEKVTDEINYLAHLKIVKNFLKLPNKRLVFASSCSMYGATNNESKKEQDAINPLTAYAKSKVMLEKVLEKQQYGHGSFATSLRFGTACGMSDRLRLDLVLNDFVASALINKKVVLLSDGTSWRPLINVSDMARSIEWAINREINVSSNHLYVNIGSNDWNYTVRQLAEAVIKQVAGSELEINSSAQTDKRSYRVNFDLFKKLAPHHQPEATLKSTITELIAGIEPIKHLLTSNFRSSNFIRLNALESQIRTNLLSPDLHWLK